MGASVRRGRFSRPGYHKLARRTRFERPGSPGRQRDLHRGGPQQRRRLRLFLGYHGERHRLPDYDQSDAAGAGRRYSTTANDQFPQIGETSYLVFGGNAMIVMDNQQRLSGIGSATSSPRDSRTTRELCPTRPAVPSRETASRRRSTAPGMSSRGQPQANCSKRFLPAATSFKASSTATAYWRARSQRFLRWCRANRPVHARPQHGCRHGNRDQQPGFAHRAGRAHLQSAVHLLRHPYEGGNTGDLRSVDVYEYSGSTWVLNPADSKYYRYYLPGETDGFPDAVKFQFSGASLARMEADDSIPIPRDSTVEPYADKFFEYDSQGRVTEERLGRRELFQRRHRHNRLPVRGRHRSGRRQQRQRLAQRDHRTRGDSSKVTTFYNCLGDELLTDTWNGQRAPPRSTRSPTRCTTTTATSSRPPSPRRSTRASRRPSTARKSTVTTHRRRTWAEPQLRHWPDPGQRVLHLDRDQLSGRRGGLPPGQRRPAW